MELSLLRRASPTLLRAPHACARATRPSARPHIGAVLDPKKKGFGNVSSKAPKSNKAKDQLKQPEEQQAVSTDKQKAILLHEDSRELQSVVKSVEKDHAKKHTRRLNINKEVAAKGKVDFVKVESWGDEDRDQSALDNLKVKSFSPAFSSSNTSGPFYERLVQRLQLLESKGDISVVHTQSLPKFQHWAFGEERYLQYLVDQHAVFDALRSCIANIGDPKNNAVPSDEVTNFKEAASAVEIFGAALGLERSEALQADIKALSKAISDAKNKTVEPPKPTTQTIAYAKYLKQLASLGDGIAQRKEGCLHLLAHIFAVYVTHLTTGMRIGAKALDCVSVLKQAKGVSFYRDYPQHVTDPLKVFIAAVNKVADFVPTSEGQELVMEELPKAIQKTSLLLVLLAVTEQREDEALSAAAASA